jgi:hypothetical protein
MPDKSRFEREIDEILEKSDSDNGAKAPRKRSFEPFSPTVPKRRRSRKPTGIKLNAGNLILLGVVLLAVAAFVPVARLPLAVIGFGFVAVGYVLWFRTGGGFSGGLPGRGGAGRTGGSRANDEPQVKYWRGRRIEEKPDRPSPEDRGKIIEFGAPDDDSDPGAK